MWDGLWVGGNVATMDGDGFGAVAKGAIGVEAGRIAWVGPAADLPDRPEVLARTVHDATGLWITPGLIDCHTHLIFAGDRVGEFVRQIEGATRRELAAEGGGIQFSVRATRAADDETLRVGAQKRLDTLMAHGVTTIEIKSGYGLDLDTELRMLRIARGLGRDNPVTVATSFLGAHGVAPEYAGRPDEYIDFLIETVLPAAVDEGLVDMCDGGIEGLTIPQDAMLRLYAAAKARGIPVRGHTDQYRDVGGSGVLARIGARSADHLEYANPQSIQAMAESGTVAVLLPGATFFLRETRMPPIDLFRQHGVAMALATNCNPGSSPTLSPLLVMAMACTMFRMRPAEALAGFTVHAAKALAREDEIGRLTPGYAADFVLWDVGSAEELSYWLGGNPCRQVVKAGKIVR